VSELASGNPQPDYVVISQTHINRWDESTQRAIAGWEVTVRDGYTGVTVPVFVADDFYTPDNVRLLIEQTLTPVREVHGLGR